MKDRGRDLIWGTPRYVRGRRTTTKNWFLVRVLTQEPLKYSAPVLHNQPQRYGKSISSVTIMLCLPTLYLKMYPKLHWPTCKTEIILGWYKNITLHEMIIYWYVTPCTVTEMQWRFRVTFSSRQWMQQVSLKQTHSRLTTWPHIPKDSYLNSQRCEYLTCLYIIRTTLGVGLKR
jgi:hypothetical protein